MCWSRSGQFPKNGGCPVNSVGACVICIPKLTASPVLRQLSVQKLMEIESRHRSLFDPRPARWKLAHSTLGCTSSHRALIPLMHVDRTRPQGCSGCLILVALPAVARLAAIRAMSTKSREVLFGSRISGAKIRAEGAREAPNRPCARRTAPTPKHGRSEWQEHAQDQRSHPQRSRNA